MALKKPEEYKESVRDDRVVYYRGEKVDDVTKHDALKIGVETAALDYKMAEDPEYKDLAVVEDPELNEPISRYYYTPKTEEDLLKRHELMVEATRMGNGVIPFSHDIGADAMNAVSMTAQTMGEEKYIERAENYREYLKKNDLSLAGAMTDVKGDRSLRPSSPDQKHPDYYVRVVEEKDDGIIVRGAKAHITSSAYFNELLVLPTRNMTEQDKDYAVSFAIPANADGVKHICHPMRTRHEFPTGRPVRGHTDCLIVFDDVFVPWDRVFLCKEWKYAMPLVYNFAVLHRHTAVSYRIPISEALVGVAQAMAEYNGIEDATHIKDKITELIMYTDTLKSLGKASCLDHDVHGGIPIPNPTITNIAKYHFANNYHDCVKMIQDITGGLLATIPSYEDYQNPETKDYIEKYLGGNADFPTEDRIKMIYYIRELLRSSAEVTAIHAEGSLQAQRRTTLTESQEKIQEYKNKAEESAGIQSD